ncbi:leucine-rich repeat domain-containing protein [Eubacterium oxidoreducens]|uniref:Leucine rich repeat-containing protein n=1 Tax=Eubacterium oxidoreducens TaxID=1732 RepID=A0A1G6CIC0_EUBOX|nr:leucine-rich repeat domain-containing protein [Eubacterium oxidoreducens]SDB32649.1 Leucine rich repeat-containing protein [Eubacterium oxidoreducens]
MKQRKKIIAWVLAFAMVVAVAAPASQAIVAKGSSVTADETEQEFVITDGVLTAYNGTGGAVSIPSGVTKVAASAFSGNPSITSVSFASSVKTIAAGAFSNCTNLSSVSIPSTITSVGSSAFAGCSSLSSVSYSSSSFPASVFSGCTSLSSFTVPSGAGSIPSGAFANCSNLTSVNLGSVSSIDFSAFSGCTNLTSISVSGSYSSSDGCVYSGNKLLYVPRGKTSVSIKSGTTTIASGAFTGCTMTSLKIPSSVKTIESGAFSSSSIGTVTIPSSVTSIGAQSGWEVNLIRGKSKSAANKYANNNNIPFEAIDSSSDEEDSSSDEEESESSGSSSGSSGSSASTSGSLDPSSPNYYGVEVISGIDDTIETKTIQVADDQEPFTRKEMKQYIRWNKNYNISFETEDGIMVKFAKGSMSLVDDVDEYDMRVNLILKYKKRTVDAQEMNSKNFAFELDYYYEGELPATAYVYVPIGTKYAGETLYYYMCEDDQLENISYGTVSEDGYLVVSQNHCSNYVGLSEGIHVKDGTPTTADGFDIRYLLIIAVAAVGGYLLIIRRNGKSA